MLYNHCPPLELPNLVSETKPDGKSTELKLNILQVWIKEKKDWKLMARQAVKVS